MEIADFIEGIENDALSEAELIQVLKSHGHYPYSDEGECDFCISAVERLEESSSVPELIWNLETIDSSRSEVHQVICSQFNVLDQNEVSVDTWLFHASMSSSACPTEIVETFIDRACEMLDPVSFIAYRADDVDDLIWGYKSWLQDLNRVGTSEQVKKFSMGFHENFVNCSGEWISCLLCQDAIS